MQIVDCHGHIFPPMAEASGFASRAEHLLYLQWGMHTHRNQPVVRSRDGKIVDELHLWDPSDPGESGRMAGLDFRADGNGRPLGIGPAGPQHQVGDAHPALPTSVLDGAGS